MILGLTLRTPKKRSLPNLCHHPHPTRVPYYRLYMDSLCCPHWDRINFSVGKEYKSVNVGHATSFSLHIDFHWYN